MIRSKSGSVTVFVKKNGAEIGTRRKFKNWKSALRCGILFASNEVMHRPRSDFPLYFNIGNISKFVWKNQMLALGVCLPQPLPKREPKVCRVKITFESLLTICFVSTTIKSMKYFVNWIPPISSFFSGCVCE